MRGTRSRESHRVGAEQRLAPTPSRDGGGRVHERERDQALLRERLDVMTDRQKS